MKELKKPKKQPESEWCNYTKPIEVSDTKTRYYARCPKCGKRMKPYYLNCDPGWPNPYILVKFPKHKIPKTKR